jgi:hypothetical protein
MGEMDYVISADEGRVGMNDGGVPHHSLGNKCLETLQEEEGEWEEVDEVRVWFPVFPIPSGTLHLDFPGVA